MVSTFVNGKIGRLLGAVGAVVFALTGQAVSAQTQGFFIGAGSGYAFDAFSSEQMESYANPYQQSVPFFLTLGASFWRMGVGLEAGYSPKKYFVNDSAHLAYGDDYKDVSFPYIPLLLKVHYQTPGAIAIRPSIFGGVSFSLRPQEPDLPARQERDQGQNLIVDIPAVKGAEASNDIAVNMGAGLDLVFSFSGNMALFFGGAFTAMIPAAGNNNAMYFYPEVRAGLTLYPFSGDSSGSANKGRSTPYSPSNRPRPSYTQAASNNGGSSNTVPGNELLAQMRNPDGSPSSQPYTNTPAAVQPAASQIAQPAAQAQAAAPQPAAAPAQTAAPQVAAEPAAAAAPQPAAAAAPQTAAAAAPQTAAAPATPAAAPQTAAAPAQTAAPQLAAAPAQAPAAQTAAPQQAAADPATQAAAKKALEEQRAEIAAIKQEVQQTRAELADTMASGGEQTALRELQQSTGAVVNAKDGASAAHATLPGARTDTVYFFPDVTSPMVVFSLPVVDEVGRRLKENPNLVVFIRGYSAPAGNAEGQKVVSESRARYTAEYLHNHFGIPFDRMTIEWFGAAKKPEQAGQYHDDGLFRAVELITAPRIAAAR